MAFTLLVGGVRSGKSRAAERLAGLSDSPVVFVATATAGDDEMALRIDRHRMRRPAEWATVEQPMDLVSVLREVDDRSFVVVDCLTLWVTNLFGAGWEDDAIFRAADLVAASLADRQGPAAVVSNEVGWGIVPENAMARRFRDVLGGVNTKFGDRAESSMLMVAGRALNMERFPDG